MDENLPLALAHWLRDRGVDAEHTSSLGLNSTSDHEIARRAEDDGAIVMTKDADYVSLARAGRGPRVIHVRSGNLDTARLLELLERVWADVAAAVRSGERVIEIGGAR